jgi:hypothetical protein
MYGTNTDAAEVATVAVAIPRQLCKLGLLRLATECVTQGVDAMFAACQHRAAQSAQPDSGYEIDRN